MTGLQEQMDMLRLRLIRKFYVCVFHSSAEQLWLLDRPGKLLCTEAIMPKQTVFVIRDQ